MPEIDIRKSEGVSLIRMSGVMTMPDRLKVMRTLADPAVRNTCPRTVIDLRNVDEESDSSEEVEFGMTIARHLDAFDGRRTAVLVNPRFLVSSMVCWNLQKLGATIIDCLSETEARDWLENVRSLRA